MSQYLDSIRSAEEFINVPPFPAGYKPKEIEVFFGNSPIDSTYHYRNGEWFDINLENSGAEPVTQILIDNQWAFIQVENKVLLDRMSGVELPEIPNKEYFVSQITKKLQK